MSKFYAIDEAAEILGITADLLSSWIAEGQATATKRSGVLVLRQQEVQRLMSVPPVFSSSQGGADVPTDDGSPLESLPLDGGLDDTRAGGGRVERLSVTPRKASGGFDAVAPAQNASVEHRFEDGALPSRSGFLPVAGSRKGGHPADASGTSSVDDGDDGDFVDAALPSNSAAARGERRSGMSTPRLLGAGERRRGGMMRRNEEVAAASSAQNVSVQPAGGGLSLEQAVEKAIDPLARTQARLIKYFNEFKDGLAASAPGTGQAPVAWEESLARIEARMEKMSGAAGAVSAVELKSFRRNTEASINALQESLRGLEQRLMERSGSAAGESSVVVEELKATLAMRSTDLEAAKAETASLREEIRGLQEEYRGLLVKNSDTEKELAEVGAREKGQQPRIEELNEQLNVLREEHDVVQSQLSSLREQQSELQNELAQTRGDLENAGTRSTLLGQAIAQLDGLRESLDAGEASEEEFLAKVMAAIEVKDKEFHSLEAKYDACEEENSTLQLLITQLQRGGTGVSPQLQTEIEEGRAARVKLQEEIADANDSLKKLTAEHDSLKSAHEDLQVEHEALITKSGELETALAEAKAAAENMPVADPEAESKLASLQEECDEAKAAVEKAELELDALRTSSTEMESELTALREERSKLHESSSDLMDGQSKLQQELDSEREAHDLLKDEAFHTKEALEKVQEELAQQASEHAKVVDELQSVYASNAQLQEDYNGLREECTALQEECEKTKQSLSDLEASNGDADGRVSELETRLHEAQEEAKTAGTRCEELTAELSKASENAAALQEELAERTQESEASQVEIVSLQTQLNSTKAQLAELDTVIKDSHGESAELTAQIETKDGIISELNDKISLVQANVQGMSERLDVATKENETLRQSLNENEQVVAGLRKELGESQQRETELAAAKSEHAKGVAEVEKRCETLSAELEAERARNAAQLEAKEKLFRDAQEGLAKLESERNRLLKRQNTLQARVQALRAEIDEAKDAQQDYDAARDEEARLTTEVVALKSQLAEAERRASEAEAAQSKVVGDVQAAKEQIAGYEDKLKALEYEVSVGGNKSSAPASREMLARIASLEADASEKDRLIQDGHRERAELRDELDNSQRALYELQQQHEKEKREWSEILARQIKGIEGQHGEESSEGEAPQRRGAGGWRLFNKRGGA